MQEAFGPAGTPTVGCEFVPNDNITKRLVYVTQYFVDNGFTVVLTNHIDQDRTILDRPGDWVDGWQRLLSACIAGDNSEKYKQHVVVDLANEPDSQGLTCVPCYGKNLVTKKQSLRCPAGLGVRGLCSERCCPLPENTSPVLWKRLNMQVVESPACCAACKHIIARWLRR